MADQTPKAPDPKAPPKAPKVTCKDVIKACDQALSDKDKEIQGMKTENKDLKTLSDTTQKDAQDAHDKLKSPLRNPLLLAGIGATAGMIIGGPIAIGIGLIGGLLIHF